MKRIISVIICAVIILTLTGCDSGDYKKAVEFFESGEYAKAADIFLQLSDYKDSQSYWCKANYQIGKQYLEQEDYENAEKVLQKSQDSDEEAKKLLNWSRFERAKAQLRHGNHLNAIDILIQIGDYGNYPAYLSEVRYNYGVVCYNAGEYETAAEYFGKSQKSEAQALKYKAQYYSAVKQTNAGKYVAAYETFSSLGNANFDDRVKAANHAVDLYKKLMRYTWKMQYNSEKQICFAFRENVGTMYIFTMNNGKVVSSTSPVVFQMIYAYDGILLVESSGTSHSLKTSFVSTDSVKLSFKTEGLQQANGTYQKESLSADHALSHTINEAATPITVPSYSFSLEKATLTPSNDNNATTNSKEDTSVAVDSSSQVESEVSSNDTTSTASQTGNSNNTSSTASQTGNSNNTSSTTLKNTIPDNTSSNFSQSSKPNSTTSTVSQGKKPNTPTTEQHVHDFSINATCEEPAKCSCGETSGLAIGHNWESATCEKPDTCKNCGKTRGSALGHDWEEATCEEAKTCKNCGKKEGKAWGHTYNSTEILICERCRELNPEGEKIISKLSVVNNSDLFTLDSFSISNYGKQSHIYDLGYKFDMDFKITLNESIMRDQVTIIAYDENGNELYESGFGFLPSSSGLKGDTISKQARFHIDGYKPVAKVVIK